MITLNKEVLCDALKMLSSIQTARSPMPILSCVHIKLDGGSLTLTASCLDQRMSVDVSPGEIEIGAQLEVCVPLRAFATIASGAAAEVVIGAVLAGDATMEVSHENGSAKLPIMDAADFPEDSSAKVDSWRSLSKEDGERIRKVQPAQSKDPTRYILNGVLFCEHGFISTDGKRLMKATLEQSGIQDSYVVPADGVKAMVDILAASEEQAASWAAVGNTIQLKCGRVRFSTSLIEGNFPHWMSVIPKHEDFHQLQVNVSTAVSALNTILSLGHNYCRIEKDESGWTLSGAGTEKKAEVADYSAPITCDDQGKIEKHSQKVDAKFLLELLQFTLADEADLRVRDNDPLVILDGDDLALMMPFRL